MPELKIDDPRPIGQGNRVARVDVAVTAGGEALSGAWVRTSGNGQAAPASFDWRYDTQPEGTIEVLYKGHVVYRGELAAQEGNPGTWSRTVEVDVAPAPAFVGIGGAVRGGSDVHVGWTAPTADESYEISAAATRQALFSDAAYTITETGTKATLIGYEPGGWVAVRPQGAAAHFTAVAVDELAAGGAVTSVDIQARTGQPGEQLTIVAAALDASGNPAGPVDFTGAVFDDVGDYHVTLSPSEAVTITATSRDDVLVSSSITLTPAGTEPAAPENAGFYPLTDGTSAVVYWDGPEGHYRVSALGSTMDTSAPRMTLRGLPEGTAVPVVIQTVGNEASVTLQVTALRTARRPSAVALGALPTLRVAPGASIDIDLTAYTHLGPFFVGATQADRWAASSARAIAEGSCTASLAGATLTVSCPSAARVGDEPTLVIIEVPGEAPSALATIAVPSGTSEAVAADHVLAHSRGAQAPEGATARPTRWATPDASVASGAVRSPGEGTSASLFESGDDLILVYLVDTDAATIAARVAFTEVETDAWRPLSIDRAITSPALFSGVRRYRTASRLFEADGTELAWRAPLWLGERWLDQSAFPSDAVLAGTGAARHVRFRGQLDGPSGAAGVPDLDRLDVAAGPHSARMTWSLSVEGTPVDVPWAVELALVGQQGHRAVGTGGASFDGLEADTVYEATLEGFAPVSFRTLKAPPSIAVTGRVAGQGRYVYEATPSAAVDSFDFGGSTHAGTATVELATREGHLSFSATAYASPVVISSQVNWDVPLAGTTFDIEAAIHAEIDPESFPEPSFWGGSAAGKAEHTVSAGVIAPGAWRVTLDGHLPTGMPGELEDHASAELVWSSGRGREVDFEVPTEAAVVIEVRASGGLSPVVYGAVVSPA